MIKKQAKIGIAIGIISVVVLAIFMLQPTIIEQSAYDDPNLGVVVVEVTQQNFIQRLFASLSQTIYFSQSTAHIGDRITISDKGLIYSTDQNFPDIWQPGDKAVIMLKVDGVNYQPYDVSIPNTITSSTKISVTYTANKVGQHSADLYRSRPGSDSNTKLDSSFTGVTVTEAPSNDCNKEERWTSWEIVEQIIGGDHYKRIWQTVDGDCNYVNSNVAERKTICDSGYDISGSSTATVMTGYQQCELIDTEPEGCTADVTTSCPGGSVIVIEDCVNGELTPTGNECEAINYIDVWRFEDNSCSPLQIIESERGDNDYETVIECSALIEGVNTTNPVTITIYRFQNNKCTQITIDESYRTENDYDSITACAANIADSVTVYQSVGGACVETVISRATQKDTDFITEALCLASLSDGVGGFDLDSIGDAPWIVIGGAAFAGVAVLFLLRRRR